MPTCDVEYRTASYKGIEFEILPVSNAIGQRLVVNLYPFSDFHYNERLGRKPETWTVRGLFTGADARDRLQVAKRLWSTNSAGVFFEPTENRSHSVELNEDVVFEYDNTKINHVRFTMQFIEASNDPYPARVAGLFGRANAAIDDFINTVSDFYSGVMETVSSFSDVLTGFEAANDFLFDTTRQTVSGVGFADVIAEVNSAAPSSSPATTSETVIALFESANDADAPIEFYQQSTEVRVVGNDAEQLQGQLFGLVALGYYFEKAADDGVTYSELRDFRVRALALKNEVNDPAISEAIDRLICQLGQGAESIECKTLDGTHHALVASYKLYGDISRANDIISYSGGVSGSALSPLLYR